MDRLIKGLKKINRTVKVPGDKSISHRALMIGAISRGITRITGLSQGRDVMSTSRCLECLGVEIERNGSDVYVYGKGRRGLSQPLDVLDAGNSGTTIRLLTGLLAPQPFVSEITGDDSLRKRPMNRIIEPMRLMGAKIEAEDGGRAPLKIYGSHLRPIEYTTEVASAQVKSCIMLAAMYAEGTTRIREPAISRDHTERMLKHFGVSITREGSEVSIDGPCDFKGVDIAVPADISSAAFFMVAASIIPGSEIVLPDVGMNPTRTGIVDVLEKMGGSLRIENMQEVSGELRADIIISSGELHGAVVGGELIPRIIDEIPVIAVAATQAKGETVIRDAKELRVKETDRIEAVVKNIRRMGGEIEEHEDGFSIIGPQELRGAELDSFGDHRIAMAFSIAGLVADGETVIKNAECAEISFPGFFDILDQISNG